jgi:hypothetical protein
MDFGESYPLLSAPAFQIGQIGAERLLQHRKQESALAIQEFPPIDEVEILHRQNGTAEMFQG